MACHTSGEPAGRWGSIGASRLILSHRSLCWPGQCKVAILSCHRYTPTYKFDVSISDPGAIRRENLNLEKISPAYPCGRERATLAVSFQKR